MKRYHVMAAVIVIIAAFAIFILAGIIRTISMHILPVGGVLFMAACFLAPCILLEVCAIDDYKRAKKED